MKLTNNQILAIFEIICIIAIVYFSGRAFYMIQIDSKECFESPLTYSARRFDEANKNSHFSCTCDFGVQDSPVIYFDKDEVKTLHDSSKNAMNNDLDMDFLNEFIKTLEN